VTYKSTRPCRRQGHMENPKGLTSFPCLCVRSASRVEKAKATRQAGQRCARRKETEPKARPWPPRERVCACGGARLREGARDFTGAGACACQRLVHGDGPERCRTTRRPKESRDGTKQYARVAGMAAAPARRRFPAWHEGRHHVWRAKWSPTVKESAKRCATQ
jgi:hypothetical protein